MKWITREPQSKHVYSIDCIDIDKSIFELTPEELGCESTTNATTSEWDHFNHTTTRFWYLTREPTKSHEFNRTKGWHYNTTRNHKWHF